MTRTENKITDQSNALEIANALTHGFGFLVGIALLPVVTAISARVDRISAIVAAAIYAFSFLMVFIFSTLYHAMRDPDAKFILQKLDHISIYFMIAGTYTPFLLIYLFNAFGITLLSVLWGLTLFGIIFKILFTGRFALVSTLIYLAMGWILLVGGKTFFSAMPTSVLVMMFIGGGLYSIGTPLYLIKRWKYHHVVWHIFVLAAAVCHYVAVLLAVINAPAA